LGVIGLARQTTRKGQSKKKKGKNGLTKIKGRTILQHNHRIDPDGPQPKKTQ